MTNDDDKAKPISLAVERAKRERDFAQERLDLARELEEIGVTELAATVQHVMFVEWAVFKAASMLEYHGIDQDARAVVRLAELMIRGK